MVPKNGIGEHTLKKQLNSAQTDAIYLVIQYIWYLEVLETTFRYLWEGDNVVETWSHGCSLSLGHYGTREQHWGACSRSHKPQHEIMLYHYLDNIYETSGGVAKPFLYP